LIPSPELGRSIEAAVKLLEKSGISASNRKTLTNGIRITFSHSRRNCGINFYYSRKKGFSVVPSGGDHHLAEKIRGLLLSDADELPDETWTGSDEAGKGDYMGPLTAAAVYTDRRRAEIFRKMGITDSKVLSNETVREYAARIRGSSEGLYSIVSVTPLQYNTRFNQLSRKGLNSLDMLAECHGSAITHLLDDNPEPSRIIIDRFCDEKRIEHLLPEGNFKLDLRVRGESDPAVAAASILARDAYLGGLDDISRRFGIQAVSGSGRATDMVVREFVNKFGADILDEIVKVHFKNTLKVLSLFG